MAADTSGSDTRATILEAAIDILADDGMAGFTHRRIEDRAGVSHGSTTYHFGSRDALIDAATDRVLELESELTVRAMQETFGGGASAMLSPSLPANLDWSKPEVMALAHRLADVTLRLMITETRTVRARFELYLNAARHPESAERLAAARGAIYAAQEAQAAALGYPEPQLYARLLPALMDGFVAHYLGVPDAVIRERGADLLVASMIALFADLPRTWRTGGIPAAG